MKTLVIFEFVFFLFSFSFLSAAELQVEIHKIPANGLVVQKVDLDPAIRWFNLKSVGGIELRCGDVVIPSQYIVANTNHTTIQLITQFPDEFIRRSQSETLICTLNILSGDDSVAKPKLIDEIITETSEYRIRQSVKLQGGMPSRIEFLKTGRVLETHQWFDRLYHPNHNGFNVTGSTDVRLTLLAEGSLCRVIRNDVLLQGNDLPPEKAPRISYTWYYFKQHPGLVFVTADYSQPEPTEWKELHFLELHIRDGSFAEYCDLKKPTEKTKFNGSKKTLTADGAAILDGENRIAIFGSGTVMVYDGLHEFGPYILGNAHQAWIPWTETNGFQSRWIQFDTGKASIHDVSYHANVRISIPELDQTAKTWLDVARNALFYAGIIKTKEELNIFRADNNRFITIQSHHLGMLLEKTVTEKDQGVRLVALVDIPSLTLLTPPEPQSLFTVKLREKQNGKTDFVLRNLTSDCGWQSVDIVSVSQYDEQYLTFAGVPNISGGETVRLTLTVKPQYNTETKIWYDRSSISITWKDNIVLPPNLTLQSAVLPQLRLASFGTKMKGFYPQSSGIVVNNPFNENDIHWNGRYPGGWSSMPWFTVWNDADEKSKQVGLYVAAHDVNGTTKELSFHSDFQTETVQISEEYPAENLGQPNSCFAPCRIVLESYQGDWFDAALMYRDWVRRESAWYPRTKITAEGRTDTPLWMRELAIWSQHWQSEPSKMPDELRKFQIPFGVPVAVHWYGWHKNPFDNDYPHYFPTQNGFKAAVAEIQKGNDLFVMPYINGRLWDRRDRGLEDYLFTKEALTGVTKKEDGSFEFETYGSQESDGSKVELGVMCPSSDVWKNKLRELIVRLTGADKSKPGDDGNMGVKAVYVDQVAAATPVLCFDVSHGHPLGGGDWWVKSYRNIFEKIRAELPKDTMLTTECNAEPYIDLFDGYLTWHFQHNNEVPAFAAVYGGAIQMFGRHYGDGPDHVIATKIKIAESFVFGEQIGWISPHVVNEPQKYEFLKKIVALRYQFREFFYKGEMARPPKLHGNMPRITADWRFGGYPTIVTTDIVRTGAWRIPSQKKAILLFANFSDQSLENRLEFDVTELNFNPAKIKVTRYNTDGTMIDLSGFPDSLKFAAEEVFVLKIEGIDE
ncbi:MAG: DUF6259 domain-containing protein [Planctomycetaceae bacterium]|jgi:hypothetical protein|nr:DUF6259 domain-containing protein [Planctomycetaceae bacterium]